MCTLLVCTSSIGCDGITDLKHLMTSATLVGKQYVASKMSSNLSSLLLGTNIHDLSPVGLVKMSVDAFEAACVFLCTNT